MERRQVGVTEAREHLPELVAEVRDHPITLLRRNQEVAVLIHPNRLREFEDLIMELEDRNAILKSKLEPQETVTHEEVVAGERV